MWIRWGETPGFDRASIFRMLMFLFIAGVVLTVFMRVGMSWWIIFFIMPIMWGGLGSRRHGMRRGDHLPNLDALFDEKPKRKNDAFGGDEGYDADEKLKYAEFRIGDDGELIEVKPDDAPTYAERPVTPKRRSVVDDDIEYV